ncbi:mediator of RNA polymerase II transcription subunit 25 isoform X4 [Phlebotomus papatasi]|uniref:mediator of RNA polymerase II transcription subunit 25 isoform X4 n=1 Tax=Phlebotomus papatasi TaxID=29031 RepID=UPI0024841AF2|nr:mediator of RNA polymerase II transcription subunit 25 isoform X4 [Phlebotomus papatasi]
MVSADLDSLADVVFLIEGTAINGAYINDIKSNYIIPTLEYFSQWIGDDREYWTGLDRNSTLYGIVVYKTAQSMPGVCCTTYGPFASSKKVLNTIEKLELTGGKSESYANLAEGMATTLVCFDDLEERRDQGTLTQKHCILICNSVPYSMPVQECYMYENKTVDQLASIFQEKEINFSILSPRKIPVLFKLFEKSGGDLSSSTSKNYCKDPRHLVLLKGYSLKERPASPPATATINLPSPLASNMIPMSNQMEAAGNQMLAAPNITQSGPMRSNMNNTAMFQDNMQNPMGNPNIPRPGLMYPGQGPNPNQMNPQVSIAPPNQPTGVPMGYNPNVQQQQQMNPRMPNTRWMMPPQQQRPFLANPNPTQNPQQQQMPNQQQQQQSALITQLSTPPHSMASQGVGQMGNMAQQQAIRMQHPQQMQQQNQGPPVSQQMPQAIPTSAQQHMPTASGVPTTAAGGAVGGQAGSNSREKIWTGILEWIEKAKSDQPKIARHVPCYVTTNIKDGEPELKADSWPQKLIMQLMPKQLVGNIGGQYLKDSKTVIFHPSQCEALDALSKVMATGFAGCVHFTASPPTNCEIKVLILLYTVEKKAFIGFIPNNQLGFVERLRKVIQQKQGLVRHGQNQQAAGQQGGAPGGNPGNAGNAGAGGQGPGGPSGAGQSNVMNPAASMPTSQPTSQMMPQMGQTSTAQMGQQQGVNQATRMGMVNMPNVGNPNQMGGMHNVNPGGQHMDNRQQNMEKMSHLKQSLEAQQQQFKNFEFGQMPIHQMPDNMQMAMLQQQQQQMRGVGNLGNPQQQNPQRMMRPVMASNPGLRHLLQQQQQQPQNPPYRQVMGMQGGNPGGPQMGVRPQQGGNPQPQQPFEDSNFDFI